MRGLNTVTHGFPGESPDLPDTSAEWIVEGFFSGNSEAPFADFGSATFTGASAIVNRTTVTPGGGDAVNIFLETDGQVLTLTTISGGTVTVDHE
jgi:hypothetical protein